MGLFDFFKPKQQNPVVIKKNTTIIKKNTVVIKKKKEEPKVEAKSETPNKVEVTVPQVAPVSVEPVKQTVSVENKNVPSVNRYENLIVCLDPGHASTTGGKKSPYTLNKVKPELDFYEYKFNREICKILAKKLSELNIEYFITTDEKRDGDIDVSLTTRASRAWAKIKASKKKGVFISVHANANGRGSAWDKAKGWSAYTTKGNNISDTFAEIFYDEAEKIFKPKELSIRVSKGDGDRDWEENFTVIFKTEQFSTVNGKPTVPAVLTENFFYTNIEDCKYLLSQEGMLDIAKVHLNAILAFANKIYKM